MERILVLLFLLTILLFQPAMAETSVTKSQPIQADQIEKPYANFTECTKTFPLGVEKLFYLTLVAANENNFQIKEIQTKSGYIVFETGYRKYLASIIYVSSEKSMLKITPYSGNYDFSPEVVKKMFNHIEINQSTQF